MNDNGKDLNRKERQGRQRLVLCKSGFAFFDRFSSLEALIAAFTTAEGLRFAGGSHVCAVLPVATALLGRKDEVGLYCRHQYALIGNLPKLAAGRLYPSLAG
jgi:hypothetical protein